MYSLNRFLFYAAICLAASACQNNDSATNQLPFPKFPVYKKLNPEQTGLQLNGGPPSAGSGLAVADFNLDGLPDLYFAAGKGSNQLFLNRGGMRFEDVTATAGVALPNGIKTGIAVADVNSDGWPDIFQCRSGATFADRGNQLFVNQRSPAESGCSFLNQAGSYRLNTSFASAAAVFFDSDLDGDLDMFLVNRPIDFQEKPEALSASDRFLLNNNNLFTLVGGHGGISNRAPTRSVNLVDMNSDQAPDLLLTTDSDGPGHLYLNLLEGSFTDAWGQPQGGSSFPGVADLDNDGISDILLIDHKGENAIWRSQTEPNSGFQTISCLPGVAASNSSLLPLMGDLDNDGRQDIVLANYQLQGQVRNFVFRNIDTLKLTEVTGDWGLENAGALQAAALADLDGDGDLDLLFRNANGEGFIFQNQTIEQGHGHFLRVKLLGPVGNTTGIGAQVHLQAGGLKQVRENWPNAGLYSSVAQPLHFGLGRSEKVQRLEVVWPDGRRQVLENVPADQVLTLNHADATKG